MSEKRVVMRCGHCGNQAAFANRGTYYTAEPVNDDPDLERYTEWHLLECLSCSRPSLFETWRIQPNDGEDESIAGPYKVLRFPSTDNSLEALPESVAKSYGEALKVRYVSPSACAVMVGRALEAVCKDKQVAGRTLSEKLKNLTASNALPPQLGQMAQQLRAIRNLGAHAAEDEVDQADVPVILDFVEAILEYLYTAPAKIAAVQERLARNKIATAEPK